MASDCGWWVEELRCIKSFQRFGLPSASGFPQVSLQISFWWVAGKESFWLWLLICYFTYNNTFLYLERTWVMTKQFQNDEGESTAVKLLNEWLFLFALVVLREMAGDEVKPPVSSLMAPCSCCRRCLYCIAHNACCYVVQDTAPLFPAWYFVKA